MENSNQDLPIDRGWAWIILIGSMLENFILVGIMKSFGIYFVEFLIAFDTQAARMSIILSMQTCFFSATSLLILTVGEIFDANRQYVMFGGAMAGVSYFVSSFSTSPEFLIGSLGIIYGAAAACAHGPAVVTLQQYFERRRGAANAIMNLGGSAGGVILPNFIRYLLDTYGLQGSLWIISGLLFNVTVAGAVFRPLNWFRRPALRSVLLVVKNTHSNNGAGDEVIKTNGQANVIINKPNYNQKVSLSKSYDDLYSVSENEVLSNGRDERINQTTRRRTASDSVTGDTVFATNIQRRYFSSFSDAWGSYANIHLDKKETSSPEHGVDSNMRNTKSSVIQKLKRLTLKQVMGSIFDLNVVRNRLFILNLTASSFAVSGAVLVITYLPPHAKDLGINDQDIALLLSIIGGMDLLNKVILAFVADSGFIKTHNIVATAIIVAGIATLLIPLYTTFWSLAIFAAVYGLFVGTFFTLTAVVVVNFIGMKNLSKGLALSMLCHGVAVMIFNPFVGLIRDNLGSYVVAFYLMGGGLFLGGCMLLLEPFARNLENSRCSKQEQVSHMRTTL